MLLSILYFILFAITFYYSYKIVANVYAKRGAPQFEFAIAAIGWAAIIVFFYN